ncbi:MAG TPA: ABC transporter ATP-binding protein [Verrucomicrobiae bacterium]|nr:ABC transporter ATP-binding protein [Verrucomicrobiae bacterium]
MLAVSFSIVEALLYTINPHVLRHLIDTLNHGAKVGWDKSLSVPVPYLPVMDTWSTVQWLVGLMIVFSILWYSAYNTSTWFARNATYHSSVTFGTEAFAQILAQSMDFHVTSRKGEVLKRADDAVINSQDFLYNAFFQDFMRAILSITMIMFVVFAIDPKLFAICAVTLGVGMYTNIIFGAWISKEEKLAWRNVTEVNARSLDVMHNIRETKIFGNEAFEARRRQVEAEGQLAPLRKVAKYWRWLTTTQNLWQWAGFAAAMFLIVLPAVRNGRLTVGQGVQFVTYYAMLFGYFMALMFRYANAQRLVPKLNDLRDLLARQPSVTDRGAVMAYSTFHNGLELKDVTFRYAANLPTVLAGVNLTIPKGKVTVITGRSGGGKTTIINLLTRLADPTSGSVLTDGVDIRFYKQRSYRRNFTVLSQEGSLFHGTIAFNISYSRLDSAREQIEEAARIAQIHDFIMSMPNGYDTIVSERGANLSGGQRRRLALARAVLARDAEVVILDEPTNDLDVATATTLLDDVFRVFAGKTIVIITHDPKVMARADQLIVVENSKATVQAPLAQVE